VSDFELVAPPDDVKPVGARVSTQKLYEQWVQLSEIHGHGHEFTAEAYAKYKMALGAEK
jgi:hypothetical protein